MAVDYFGYYGITKGINGMTNKWNDKSWQKDFLNMKSHSPADAKLLMGGVKGLKDAWRLGVLHVEYERIKKYKRKMIDSRSKLRGIKPSFLCHLIKAQKSSNTV